MKRSLKGALLSVALLLLSGCRDSRVDAARELLQAYQGGCSTNSQWLQLAVDHNERLRRVVLALKEARKEQCASVDAELGLVASLSGNVDQLLQSSEHQDYLKADAQLRELQVALAQVPDTPENADMRAALGVAIANGQVELAVARATDKSQQAVQATSRQTAATQSLGTLLSSLLGNTDQILPCASANPATAMQLATNLTAIGGSLISPVVGASAAIVGQLMNVGVQAIRDLPSEKMIWDLDSAVMPTALTCGLEAMTEFYCDAVDYQTVLHAEEDSYGHSRDTKNPLFLGLDLLARRLPIFSDWLYKVQNGSDPQRRVSADEKIRVEYKRTAVRTTRLQVTAGFNEQRTLFRDAPEVERPKLLISLVSRLAKDLSGDKDDCSHDCSGPFSIISKDRFEYGCFLVLGVPTGATVPPEYCPERTDVENLEQYLARPELLSKLLTEGIEGIFQVWDQQIFPRVDALVQAEYTAIVVDDPAAVIDLATIQKQDRIAPREALLSIRDFLGGMVARYEGERTYLQETLDQLDAVLVELARADVDAKARLMAISSALRLQIGPQLIQERIRNLVRRDLNWQREQGHLPENLRDILRITDGDLLTRLANEGSLNHRRIEDGVNEARKLTTENLRLFRQFFSKSFARAVIDMDEKIRSSHEEQIPDPRFRANTQALGRLCAFLLVSGESWPGGRHADEVGQVCSRARYSNVYRDGAGTLRELRIEDLRRELAGKPEMERVCGFHRKLRAWRLDELIRRSREPKPKVSGYSF